MVKKVVGLLLVYLFGCVCLDKLYVVEAAGEWQFSEVLANPVDEEKDEFVELYYSGQDKVNLQGWKLVDNKQEDELIDYSGQFDVGVSGLEIVAGSTLLIVDPDYVGGFNNVIGNGGVDLNSLFVITVADKNLGNGLGNGNDHLYLKDLNGNSVVDFSWSTDAGNGVSWENVGGNWQKSDRTEGNSFGIIRLAQEEKPNEEIKVFINELLPNPSGSDEEGEWVELYNDGETNVDLDGWVLEDESGSKYNLQEKSIETKSFLVISRKESLISLNNDSDKLILKDEKSNKIMEVEYSGLLEEQSWARGSDGNWLTTGRPTPGNINVFEDMTEQDVVDSQSSDSGEKTDNLSNNNGGWQRFWESGQKPVRINEFVANPEGSDDGEWIELYNSFNQEIDLSGWFLCDNKCSEQSKDGGYKIDNLKISKSGWVIIERSDSKISLDNSSDKLYLFDPNHDWVDCVAYDLTMKEGFSFAWEDENWFLTTVITKGEKNIIEEENNDVVKNTESKSSESQTKNFLSAKTLPKVGFDWMNLWQEAINWFWSKIYFFVYEKR